jgi:hypothetical protein
MNIAGQSVFWQPMLTIFRQQLDVKKNGLQNFSPDDRARVDVSAAQELRATAEPSRPRQDPFRQHDKDLRAATPRISRPRHRIVCL